MSVGCSTFIIFTQSSVLCPQSCRGDDATIRAPRDDKEIPIEQSQPAPEDSLDRLKTLFPKGGTGSAEEQAGAASTNEPRSAVGKVIYQLKDYNWEQNVNFHIGWFTILGYRDATSQDKMLFRFLTPQEHAEKRVMNSKASLLYSPPKKKSAPPRTSVGDEK